MLRVQAWFKLQLFACDKAGDLALNVVSQDIRWLDDHLGLVFNHTFGKTLRRGKRKIFSCDWVAVVCKRS